MKKKNLRAGQISYKLASCASRDPSAPAPDKERHCQTPNFKQLFPMAKNTLTPASTDPVNLSDLESTADKPAETSAVKDAEELKESAKETKETETTEKKPEVPEKSEPEGPPRPARPVSPMEQIKKDLKDAFPQVEDKYIEAFLIASEGRVDPAFNALLFLLDPTFKPEVAPKVPLKKVAPSGLTDDELLARQLQKEFDREERRRRLTASKLRQRRPQGEAEDDSPDEFEQIKKEFTQGFEEARTTINGWVSGLTKKFSQDGEEGGSGLSQSPKLFGALGGSSFNSNQASRGKKFDEDPEILSLDFNRNVKLDDEAPKLPKRTQPKEDRWQPLNSDVPVSSDAFLVTDSEDEDKK